MKYQADGFLLGEVYIQMSSLLVFYLSMFLLRALNMGIFV